MPTSELVLRSLPGPHDLELWIRAAEGERHRVWFDGDGGRTARGRYSFLTWNPHRILHATGDRIVDERIDPDGARVERREQRGNPLAALAQALDEEAAAAGSPPVPWAGGAFLALGFELADWIEQLDPAPAPREHGPLGAWPDLVVAFYDSVLAFDEITGALTVAGRIPAARPPSGVLSRLEMVGERASRLAPLTFPAPRRSPRERALDHRPVPADYVAAIAAIHEHLAAGDVYQVNLSRALRAPWPAPALDLYLRHRRSGRLPHGAFAELGEGRAVASFSPERFLARRDSRIETCPIKGTRPRAADPAADARLRAELVASAKDRAEHLMIVDLERNDLGRVAMPGSVVVDPGFEVESYATVHHLVSTVRGILRPDVSFCDLLRATFPGGSVTGAPKIRAIEILRRLEGERRRLYTGALGYWDAGGDLDLALPIRTALVAEGELEYRVGGGIVIDSSAEREWRETEDKARAMTETLAAAAATEGGVGAVAAREP